MRWPFFNELKRPLAYDPGIATKGLRVCFRCWAVGGGHIRAWLAGWRLVILREVWLVGRNIHLPRAVRD